MISVYKCDNKIDDQTSAFYQTLYDQDIVIINNKSYRLTIRYTHNNYYYTNGKSQGFKNINGIRESLNLDLFEILNRSKTLHDVIDEINILTLFK